MPVAADILAWSIRKLDTTIGTGECWDHVEKALSDSNGKTSTEIMGKRNITPNADYVWGTLIGDVRRDLKPGDILQFRNFIWRDQSLTITTRADGSSDEKEKDDEQTRPHHTAIVETVVEPGLVDVIEQNVPAGGSLQRSRLRIISFRGPEVVTEGYNGVKVKRTVIHVVSGGVRAYHPIEQPAGAKK